MDDVAWNEIGVIAFGMFMVLGIVACYLVAAWADLKRWLAQRKGK